MLRYMGTEICAQDDATLLADSAQGDRQSFALLYRRHLPGVVGFLLRESGDRELAGDLAAEVFAAALLAAGRYRAEHPSALPWLCGIARHKLQESRRRGAAERRARRRLGIPIESLDDEDLARVEDLADQGRAALELLHRLPTDQRHALHARVVEERDYEDIATEIGASQAAVRQRVSRALLWLRRQIDQETT
jgi:RNA polymerase sigma factor (sigma-70 family)